jgi:hypothetical protein
VEAWPTGRVLALIELIVCVIPPTFLWMLMTPGMLILMTAGIWFERGEVGVSTLAAVWWVGGGLGLHALWHLTMRDLGDEPTPAPPSILQTVRLLAGAMAAIFLFLQWSSGNLHIQLPAWVPIVAVLPIPAAMRQMLKYLRV